jgi:hypothetical protein
LKTFSNVGKRFKTSKTKTTWKFAFEKELTIHDIELYVSAYSGKVRVVVDDILIEDKNAMIGNVINTIIGKHSILVHLDETIKDFRCALFIDGYNFDSLEHITENKIITERVFRNNEKNINDCQNINAPIRDVIVKLKAPNFIHQNSKHITTSFIVLKEKTETEKDLEDVFSGK